MSPQEMQDQLEREAEEAYQKYQKNKTPANLGNALTSLQRYAGVLTTMDIEKAFVLVQRLDDLEDERTKGIASP